MAAPPHLPLPALMPELVEEILLHVPPDDPRPSSAPPSSASPGAASLPAPTSAAGSASSAAGARPRYSASSATSGPVAAANPSPASSPRLPPPPSACPVPPTSPTYGRTVRTMAASSSIPTLTAAATRTSPSPSGTPPRMSGRKSPGCRGTQTAGRPRCSAPPPLWALGCVTMSTATGDPSSSSSWAPPTVACSLASTRLRLPRGASRSLPSILVTVSGGSTACYFC
ncbi:unnamed protein product [Urochloa humidicola]